MFLDRIVATKQQEVADYKSIFSLEKAELTIANMQPCKGFIKSLTVRKNRTVALIAEVKKASPSKGLIREDFHPVDLALAYERAGADCISVLTDVNYFQGANEYLKQIHQKVHIPLLRKDFTIDEVQVYEARLIGADAILLIAAILTTDQMKHLLHKSQELGLDALVEVHNEQELLRVLELDVQLVGINNRDLHTFATDLSTTERLLSDIPKGITVISESGISELAHIERLQQAGAHGFLIGEHFMRQPHIETAVTSLFGAFRNL
jgi:indole-3-glycerol phosphate synthase